MGESLTDLMLYDELPDAVLETAASKCWEQAGNPFTCLLLRIGHLPLLSREIPVLGLR